MVAESLLEADEAPREALEALEQSCEAVSCPLGVSKPGFLDVSKGENLWKFKEIQLSKSGMMNFPSI